MTKKSFLNTSSGPDFKVQVLGPTRTPAFLTISASHCSAILPSVLLHMYIHCLYTNDGWQMGSNRSASEIKDQHLSTEPKGTETEKSGKATCCAERGCCGSRGREQNLLEAVFSRSFRNQEWFLTAVLALLSQAERHCVLPCPQTIQRAANLLVKE